MPGQEPFQEEPFEVTGVGGAAGQGQGHDGVAGRDLTDSQPGLARRCRVDSIAPICAMTVRMQGPSGVLFWCGIRNPAMKWATRAAGLTAPQAALVPAHLQPALAVRQIAGPGHRRALHPGGEHPADRARPGPLIGRGQVDPVCSVRRPLDPTPSVTSRQQAEPAHRSTLKTPEGSGRLPADSAAPAPPRRRPEPAPTRPPCSAAGRAEAVPLNRHAAADPGRSVPVPSRRPTRSRLVVDAGRTGAQRSPAALLPTGTAQALDSWLRQDSNAASPSNSRAAHRNQTSRIGTCHEPV